MRRRARWLWLGAATAAAAIALAACGGGGDPDTIVLYNGQHPQLTAALVAAFTTQTGIHVSVRSDDGIVLADQILQEGSSSPADVYLTENSPELMNLQQHGLLAQLPASILSQVPASEQSPTGCWVGVALRVSTLAYDPARIRAAELPSSVLDLADPQWKGRIAFAPTDSDFPPVLGAVVALDGEARAAQWLAGLRRNAQTYQDDEAVVAAVNRGDVAAGLINQYYWYRLRLQVGSGGTRSTLHYFRDHDAGSIENISGAAVLASSRHRAAAQEFVRFIDSPAGQRIISASYDFEYPARPDIAANPALPPLRTISATTVNASALGTDQTAVRLIEQAGLA
jgi:iron(III) transport system substrate-binding protein